MTRLILLAGLLMSLTSHLVAKGWEKTDVKHYYCNLEQPRAKESAYDYQAKKWSRANFDLKYYYSTPSNIEIHDGSILVHLDAHTMIVKTTRMPRPDPEFTLCKKYKINPRNICALPTDEWIV